MKACFRAEPFQLHTSIGNGCQWLVVLLRFPRVPVLPVEISHVKIYMNNKYDTRCLIKNKKFVNRSYLWYIKMSKKIITQNKKTKKTEPPCFAMASGNTVESIYRPVTEPVVILSQFTCALQYFSQYFPLLLHVHHSFFNISALRTCLCHLNEALTV